MDLREGTHKYNVDINGYQLSFTCRFIPLSDQAILFLHGLACSSDSFRNLFDKQYFPDKTLLLIDLIGFGDSEKPESFSYSMEETAGIIEELLALLPPFKIHIAAHSMSGAVALLFSQKFYSNVLSFTNIEGNLIAEDCGLLSRGIINNPFEEFQAVTFNKQKKEFSGHQQLRYEKTTPVALYKSAVSLVKWSDSGRLMEKFTLLKCRICYFYGEENRSMPVLRMFDGIPTIMISNSGHAMMTENPDEFYTKLAKFINS